MAGGTAKVFTIAPGEPFVDALARGIVAQVGDTPEALARVRVLLPTRRACRALREAFLRQSQGRTMLLPVMTPLGDVDEDDLMLEGGDLDDTLSTRPAIGAMQRQVLLAQYVRALDPDTPPEQAVRLGAELARLVDQAHTEGLDLADLPGLVSDESLSEHWQKTVRFLSIVGETWPGVLAERNMLDPAQRRDALLRARAAAWAENPPATPVIAAGSTGTIPATAHLLDVVARLPQGALVLPGLDTAAPDAVWTALDPTHPQYGMARLLDRIKVARTDVAPWPGSDTEKSPRQRLWDLALVPADATDLWRQGLDDIDLTQALGGLTRIECETPREEAAAIALILRQALQTPSKTAALVTPDRGLARRVAVEMRRWGVAVDDSAGQPLDQTQAGAFFHLVADMVAEDFHPVAVLACLKHPLAACGLEPHVLRTGARSLEAACLRGPRPEGGLKGLGERLRTFLGNKRDKRRFAKMGFAKAQVTQVLSVLKDITDPFCDVLKTGQPQPPATLLRAHADAAERLAATDAEQRRLWAGDAGEALASFIAEAFEALGRFEAIAAQDYPALIRALMANRPVRPRYALHPRVHIWGLLEARLQRADTVVLGGLNEGTWPAETQPSPWMSRPMMTAFGLPVPERRVGLSAHDFIQAAGAPDVFITRAKRAEGSPQVPSRWLTRLDTLLGEAKLPPDASWTAWAEELTRPEAEAQSCRPPKPTPPLSARPRRLSVTRIETWFRDPYSIYARYILGLEPLEPIDADAGAAEKGTVIHDVLERFIRQNMGSLPDDPEAELLDIGEKVFAQTISSPAVRAFWWPRFKRIAHWFAEFETRRRANGCAPALVEGEGEATLDGLAGPFTLTAKADRFDRTPASGLSIIDYKTGIVPSPKQTARLFSPQMQLEGLIAQRGGFKGIPADAPIEEFLYLRLSGARPPGEEKPLNVDPETAINETFAGLMRLIHKFDDPHTPYLSRTRAQFEARYGDYDHLARVKEWRTAGEGNGGDDA